MLHNFLHVLGGAPSPSNATNHATTVTGGTVTGSGGSNFKRQNTVDPTTIKENSVRVPAGRTSAPKNSPGQLDTSEFTLLSRNIRGRPCQQILFGLLCLHGASDTFLNEIASVKVAVIKWLIYRIVAISLELIHFSLLLSVYKLRRFYVILSYATFYVCSHFYRCNRGYCRKLRTYTFYSGIVVPVFCMFARENA